MSYNPKSIVTISREDDKLVVARKPVRRTRRQKFFGCFWPILIFVLLIDMVFGFLISSVGVKEAVGFLLVVGIITFAVIILAIRDNLRRWSIIPPDYNDEILTFDADKFVVQHYGMVSSFSYRFDIKPVLRHTSYPSYDPVITYPEHVDFIIPSLPMDDYVPPDYHLGYYAMSYLDITDAERIFATFKEYLEIVQHSKPRRTG